MLGLHAKRCGWCLALLVSCGDDEGSGDEQGSASDGTEASASADDDGSSATDDAATEGSTSADGSASVEGSASVDGSSGDGASTSAADDTGALACGDATCGADQTCVNPCCGGPAPLCYPASPDGTCQGADTPVPPEQCRFGGCEAEVCCDPAPCVPEPPYCVATDELSCSGTQCSVDSCSGDLDEGGALHCACA